MIVAARLSKLESKLGTLEAGKEADVIVVDGDPIADLAALDHVQMDHYADEQRQIWGRNDPAIVQRGSARRNVDTPDYYSCSWGIIL